MSRGLSDDFRHTGHYVPLLWTGDEIIAVLPTDRGIHFLRTAPGTIDLAPERVDDEPVRVSRGTVGTQHVSAVWTGTRVAVAWSADVPGTTDAAMYFRTFEADGTPSSPLVRLTPPGVNAGMKSLAWDGEAYGIAWEDSRGGIRFARGRFDCY